MGAGEGDEILMAKESAGFGAGDEEDVRALAKSRGKELVPDSGLSVD